jgi:hypothetical protein
MANNMSKPTPHERREWARMATDAYRTGHNFYWHQYSAVAAAGDTLPLPVFDALQRVYRMWLADGWTAIDGPYPTHDQAKLRTMGLTS